MRLSNCRESGEEEEIRRQHTLYFLEQAEQATDKLTGKESARWLQRLDEEHDNLRAALHWVRRATLEGRTEAEIGLRLAVSMFRLWYIRGYVSEGREWLLSMLRLPGAEKLEQLQATALGYAARLAYVQCDYVASRYLFEEIP